MTASAAFTMLAVATEWSRSKVTPRPGRSRMIPTRWISASHPSIEASRPFGVSTSPGTRSIPSNPLRSASEPGRTRQRTVKPWAWSAWITALPTKPVPPVTKTRCIAGRSLRDPTTTPEGGQRAPPFFLSRSRPDRYHRAMSRHAMAVGFALCLVAAAPVRGHEPDLRGVAAAARAALSAGEVPGAVVLVGQGERVLYRKAFGSRSLVPRQELMTEDTIFDVASLTKVVATMPAVLLLAERGKLSLDAPLRGRGEPPFRPGPAMLPRVAPTEALNSGMLRGAVHDGNARLLGGIAGHAGLFSTADDLARFVRMLLSDGKGRAGQVLKAATVKAMWSRTEVGDIVRALGWDEASPFSRPMGLFFPRGSVGHTGFTGTMLWMDPPSRTYLILLTNRVHPYGKGKVTNLRPRVAAG